MILMSCKLFAVFEVWCLILILIPFLTERYSIAAGLHKLIALTNNFAKINIPPSELTFLGWEQGTTPKQLRELFDDFCDSSELGMR